MLIPKDILEPNQTYLEEKLDDEIPTWANRPGEADPSSLYLEVGRALTRWERVEASLLETLRSMQKSLVNSNKIVRRYSRIRDAQGRIELIWKEYSRLRLTNSELNQHEQALLRTLRRYIKHKIARNRLAHGVVIMMGPTGIPEAKNGTISTYSLCPSEADHRSWLIPWRYVSSDDGKNYVVEGNDDADYINDGPTYNYLSEDIKRLSISFLRLDYRFRCLTKLFASNKDEFERLLNGLRLDYSDLST